MTDVEQRWWGNHLREVRWQGELARLLADPFDISKITRHVYRELAYTLVSRCGEGRLREEGTSAAPRSQR